MSERTKQDELNHTMLSQIACVAGAWCDCEECTTLEAVELMEAEIYELRAYKIRNEIYSRRPE